MRLLKRRDHVGERSYGRAVALFGGAFNPPHLGHVAIVRTLLRQKDIDAVWIVPVYRHPFAKDMVPFSDRIRMCRLAFGGLSHRVTIRRIEEKLGGTSYTVHTLRRLTKDHPRTRFCLVIGSDSYRQRAQWKDFAKIEQMADLMVFPRGRKKGAASISSTFVRDRLADSGSIADLVPSPVRDYIEKKGLYRLD